MFSKILLASVCSSFLISCVQVIEEQPINESRLAISSVRDLPFTYAAGSKFSLSPKYVEHVSLKPEEQKTVYQRYKNAIIENLQEDGYFLTENPAQAKFFVGFAVAIEGDLADQKITDEFGVMPGLPSTKDQEKGSLLLYIADGATQELVWRSTVQGFVRADLSDDERKVRTEKVIEMALNNFHKKK